MTKREKTLALLIAVLVAAMIGWAAISRISGAFESRYASIEQLDEEIKDKNFVLDRGTRAARKLAEYEKASLPGDPGLARSLYQGWLLELAQEKVALEGVNVGPLPSRPVGDVYYKHAFNVNCDGDLRQLTEFLHTFYSTGFLHRITRLHVKPHVNSKLLNLSLTVEAISLNTAPNVSELKPPPGQRLAGAELETYTASILNRNMFSPANQPPQLARLGTQRGNPRRSLRFQASASDPENDNLRYEFEGDVPEGARINSRTGDVSWTPPANGEYRLAIRVSDDGWPSRSDSGTVTIRIDDPPPPEPPVARVEPPGFDPATQAVLTGITDAFGKRKLFITVRTEGRILKLHVGDTIDVGTIQGKVKRIGLAEIEIETNDGQSIVIELGDSLVNA